MNAYAVIMAGGIGSRFWPESRRARPKQFLKVLGDETLIQKTVSRIETLIPPERCFVVTHVDYVEETRKQLPDVPPENIIAEPVGKNTAPCIMYAAIKLYKIDPDSVMVVLPADHLVQQTDRFHDTLRVAIEKAEDPDTLVTVGITPTHPATGYGYIQFDATTHHEGNGELKAHRVKTFAEKPDIETAERFLDSGDFVWNSGMFIWRTDSIRAAIGRHMPDTAAAFSAVEEATGEQEEAAVRAAYASCPSLSIDYGVMERADNVFVVPGSFGWNDVGDWRAVYDLSPKDEHGNAISGNVIVHDSSRCLVESDKRLIALVGIHDVVVVETDDAVLICHRDSTQQVKNVVEYLSAHQLTEYV